MSETTSEEFSEDHPPVTADGVAAPSEEPPEITREMRVELIGKLEAKAEALQTKWNRLTETLQGLLERTNKPTSVEDRVDAMADLLSALTDMVMLGESERANKIFADIDYQIGIQRQTIEYLDAQEKAVAEADETL